MKKYIFFLTASLSLASPVWGQSYEYITQSQIAAEQADMQSQHEEIERQQEKMRDDMSQMRAEMTDQRLQNAIDNANMQDYLRYH